MSIDRVGIIEAALAELGIKPWRQTRYANNTGTCLWCDNGSLTMVPDDIELEYFCQATGAEELIVRLKLIADPRIAAAMAAPSVAAPVEVTDLGEGHRALLAAGDALYRAGYNEALEEAREVFVVAIRSRFGDLPPTLEERIRKGSLGEMKEWAERLRHATRPVQVIQLTARPELSLSPLDNLPETLRRVIAFSGIDPAAPPARAEFTQTGQMWRASGAKPMPFTAAQWIDAGPPAFCWHARFPMLPGVSLHVIDAFETGQGRLEGRLWGWLKLFRKTGPEVDRGELYRYLAELPWAPAAYLNPALKWQEVAAGHLRVSLDAPDRPVTLDMRVDPEGRVTEARAADRPADVDGAFIERPWFGRFDRWQQFGDLRVPTAAEVAWELPEGPFVYWRGEVTAYTTKPAPCT